MIKTLVVAASVFVASCGLAVAEEPLVMLVMENRPPGDEENGEWHRAARRDKT